MTQTTAIPTQPHTPKDQPLQLLLEYLHSKPGISIESASQKQSTTILTSSQNPNEKVIFDLVDPSIEFGTRFPYDWESHLRKALAYNLAQKHRLEYKGEPGIYLGKICVEKLQEYYNNQTPIYLGQKYKNEPVFLAQDLLNNQQRQEIIDNLYNTAASYLKCIETERFKQLKTYLNSENIRPSDMYCKSLQEFARGILLSEFFISYPYTERKNYLTEEQKRDISLTRIVYDDDDCI